MARVSYANPQVSVAVTYNWSVTNSYLGDLDLCVVSQDAPGVGAGSGINTITTSIAPRPIFSQQLGMIVSAWEPTLGGGEFIYLKIPTTTAIPLGTVVQWDATYTASAVPANGTSAKSGVPLAVCIANTTGITGGITSQTPVQYAWFQIQGQVQALCTAVIRTINGKVFVSGTAGRLMVTSASSAQVLGARFAASNSATISCNLVYLNRSCMQSNIT